MKNSKVFLSINNRPLFMDLILVEYHYPILFTCLDNRGNMYISTCFHADAQEREWLIAQTTPNAVIDLLRNNISIRDVFPKDDTLIYLAAKSKDAQETVIQTVRADEVPEKIFPTGGMFMDADEDEFTEELVILRKRLLTKRNYELLLSFKQQQMGQKSWLIYTVSHSPQISILKEDAFETIVCKKWKGLYEPV